MIDERKVFVTFNWAEGDMFSVTCNHCKSRREFRISKTIKAVVHDCSNGTYTLEVEQ